MTVNMTDSSATSTPLNTLYVECLAVPTAEVTDALKIKWPSAVLGVPGPEVDLTETGVDTGVYESADHQVRITVRSISGLNPAALDSLVADISQNGQPINQTSNILFESGPDSRLFAVVLFNPNEDVSYEVAGTTGPDVVQIEETWKPYRIRFDAPSQLIDQMVAERKWYLNTVEVELEKVGESWYVKTNPPRVMVDGEFTPIPVDVDPITVDPQKHGSDVVYAGNINGVTVIVSIDPEKNRDEIPFPETIEAQIIIAKDPADGRLRAKMGPMGYGEKKWITARSLDGVYEGTFSGPLTRQKALNVAANAVGVPGDTASGKATITSQNMKSLMNDKLAAWTLVEDPDSGGAGWVWNAEDSQSLPANPPMWTIPQIAGPPTGNYLSLGSSVVAALKNNGSVGDESDRMLIENFTVRVAQGGISHWGRLEAKLVYQFMSAKVFYKQEDEDAKRIPAGSKIGDFKMEYVEGGVFNFDKALAEFNLANENDYAQRLREKQLAVAQNAGWKVDTNINWADATNQTLSLFGQLFDPFMWCAYMGGGEGIVLPPKGATWSAVAWEGGFLLANVVPIGRLAAKGKVFFRFVNTVDELPAGREAARALVPDEAIVRNAGRICFVAGTQVRTVTGYRSIEAIKPGDVVWSRDDKTGAVGWKPVVRTFVTNPKSVVSLHYSFGSRSGIITGTPQHPFWVEERRAWVPMGDLSSGYHLSLDDGTAARVDSIEPIVGSGFTTYNFEVMDWHTYHVAPMGAKSEMPAVWVHNAGELCEQGIEKARAIYASKGERLFEHIDVPEWQKAIIRDPKKAPGGGLIAHESKAGGGLHSGNGHTIEKHCGRTDAELRQRIIDEKKNAVSTFHSPMCADQAVALVLESPTNASEITKWLTQTTLKRPATPISLVLPFDAGRVMLKGAQNSVPGKAVSVVLERDSSMSCGYRIVTAFINP